MAKRIPSMFQVHVRLHRDLEERNNLVWPVCQDVNGFYVGGLFATEAYVSGDKIGEAVAAVYRQGGVAQVAEIIVQPVHDWLDGFQQESQEGSGLGQNF